MIDIIDLCFTVRQAYQVFNDGNDIFFAQYFLSIALIHLQFTVDLVATYFTQIITFVREEQFFDDTAGGFIIRCITTT
ncbi:hypothetical protein D3C87_1707010 [compost metagenome]